MADFTTYNQIIKSFKDIADSHLQVNSFGVGETWDLATSGTTQYPLVWAIPRDSSLQGKIFNSNWTLIFMDIQHSDLSDVDEIVSDQEQIALDFIAQLLKPNYMFDFKGDNISFNRFNERFDDLVAGVAIDITINSIFTYDRCAIPATRINITIPPGQPIAGISVVNPGNDNDIQPNLQAAINQASNGDRIILPAGTFVFNGVITTTKKVSLYSTGCTLYRSEAVSDATLLGWGAMFIYNINDRASSGIKVQGVTFKSKIPSITPNDGGSTCADYLLKFINATDFVVTNCNFYNFGNAGIFVEHYDDLARGLIYNNSFNQCKGYDGLGLGYGVVVVGNNLSWPADPLFGTNNFIFIENNSFDGCRHACSGGGSALYVARYNTITNNLIAQGLDAHERISGTGLNTYATRATEMYSNTLTNTTFKITQFANAAARAAFVPYNNGNHYAIQLDTLVTYVSTGLSAGNWAVAVLPIPSPLGPAIIAGKNAQELSNNSILIRGGESVVYNNTINGFRYGVGLIDFTVLGGGAYPIPYSPGYASGLALGSGHTGTSAAQGDGDLWVSTNTFTPYVDVSHTSLEFLNYQTMYFTLDRDYHLVSKPNYSPYTYPHPNRL